MQVAAAKNVRMWLTKVRKIKSIYHTLNLFNIDVTQKVSSEWGSQEAVIQTVFTLVSCSV